MLKLIALILTSSALIFINNFYILSIFLLFLVFITAIKSGYTSIKSRLTPLLFTVALVIIFQAFSLRLLQGLTAALKILSLSLLVFLYTSTTSISQISQTLNFLPKNFNFMLTITFSLIPVIFQEAKTIILLQKCRGYHSLNPLPVIIPLLHRALKRSEQIALTMSSRGY
jgi:energy-coupling factor transporter transmembrane protein EcfT